MPETGPTSQIAEKLADELFGEFLWTKCGPINQDWPCEHKEKHDADTHPTDVVFAYDEPYAKKRTYLQCDLKSYAKGSISKAAVKKALLSLCRQVECAEVSENWQKTYTISDGDFDICGLLFIYNHDGAYDLEFDKLLSGIKNEILDLPKRSRVYVLGPQDIRWLDNVRLEIRQMRGSGGADALPPREYCSFYYPQLSRKPNIQSADARAATMEMLSSPWITLKYNAPSENLEKYVVFVRRPAELLEEYEYLIDYLRHFQCLSRPGSVTIKVLADDPNSAVKWGQAVDRYIRGVILGNTDSDLAKIVKSIKFKPMQQIMSSFSPVVIGMDRE